MIELPALKEFHSHAEPPSLADALTFARDERESESELDPDGRKLVDQAGTNADARPAQLRQRLLDVGRARRVGLLGVRR